eukprot:TRINITY_DN68305_c0_g1_i1.p1 TRINITY_DN68305_c0_g1~~TRINITY_DN68305_c0_g1_i1.p1  ORF type:complete len:470 (+),score=74.43 TRINITY_DN68305_c0_g1_i1:144-1553(+)
MSEEDSQPTLSESDAASTLRGICRPQFDRSSFHGELAEPAIRQGPESITEWQNYASLCIRGWGRTPDASEKVPADDIRRLGRRAPEALSVVSFARKGGVGKSQTCLSLGYQLALSGKRVLIFDCDSQCTLTRNVFRENLTAFYNAHATERRSNPRLGGYDHFIETLENTLYTEPHHRNRSTLMDTLNTLQTVESGTAGTAEDELAPGQKYSSTPVSLHAYEVPYFRTVMEAAEEAEAGTVPSAAGHATGAAAAAAGAEATEGDPAKVMVVPGSLYIDSWNYILTLALKKLIGKHMKRNAGAVVWAATALSAVIATTAVRYDADIVLVDLNPADTVVNMFLLMQSHYFLLSSNCEPDAPDGLLVLLNRMLLAEPKDEQRWARIWWKLQAHVFKGCIYPQSVLPRRFPKFLGQVLCFVPKDGFGKFKDGGQKEPEIRDGVISIVVTRGARARIEHLVQVKVNREVCWRYRK